MVNYGGYIGLQTKNNVINVYLNEAALIYILKSKRKTFSESVVMVCLKWVQERNIYIFLLLFTY